MCQLKVTALPLIICVSFAEIIVRGGKSTNIIFRRKWNTEILRIESF